MSSDGEMVDDLASLPDASSPHLPPGYVVGGKYVIRKLLGEGANGSVYEGEHSQIGHRVAIKVVHKSLASRQDITSRFQREARICGTIRNRHVGQVYDVGELPEGAPYMVMELHEGRSLGQVLAQDGAPPIGVVIDVIRQLLVGLQAAHDTGVIHRDIKPDNIMLVRESSGQSVVKLVDFGISKNVTADIRARNVTQEGVVVGSPDYMPPEQLKGESVDHRVDVYAAGVVLYEAVCGRVPFNADSMTELFVAILRDPMTPPRSVRTDCPPELERVILRAMERNAGRRFQSAAEMERALAEVQRTYGLSSGDLHRYSQRPPPADGPGVPTRSSNAISEGGYALETERVRTAELRLPVRRASSRVALAAVGVVVLGAGLVWTMRSADDGAAHSVTPRPQQQAASSIMPVALTEPVAIAAAPEPVKQAAAEPIPPALDGEKAARVGEPDQPGPTAAPAIARGDKQLKKRAAEADLGHKVDSVKAQHVSPTADSQKPATRGPSAAAAAAQAAAAAELVQQASASFVRGQMPRARALYREATEKVAANADAWRGLGMVSSRMGEREEAARAFKRYLALRPNAPDAEAIRKKLEGL